MTRCLRPNASKKYFLGVLFEGFTRRSMAFRKIESKRGKAKQRFKWEWCISKRFEVTFSRKTLSSRRESGNLTKVNSAIVAIPDVGVSRDSGGCPSHPRFGNKWRHRLSARRGSRNLERANGISAQVKLAPAKRFMIYTSHAQIIGIACQKTQSRRAAWPSG